MTRQKVTAIVILVALLLVFTVAGVYAAGKLRGNPVTISVDGEAKTLLVKKGATVQEALDQAGVTLGPQDRVHPGLWERVAYGASLQITRVQMKTRFEEIALPYKTEVNRDASLPKGQTATRREGRAGVQRREIREIYEDGQLVSSQLVAANVLREPVDQVEVVGTGPERVVTRGGTPIRYKKAMEMVATAYDATYESNDRWTGYPSALGLPLEHGIVAVDPEVIPLGTRLYVEGYGLALAADTGGAIKGNRIDLFFDDPAEVDKYGIKTVKVYILE